MAGIEIRLTQRGLDGFRRARPNTLLARVGRNLTLKLANRTLEEALTEVPRDTDILAESGEVVEYGVMGAAVRFTAPYSRFVHGPIDGSGEGQRTEPHWPPWSPGTALDDWAQRHGIPTFLLARHISQYGTPYVPFLARAKRRVLQSEYQQYKQEAVQEFFAALMRGESE